MLSPDKCRKRALIKISYKVILNLRQKSFLLRMVRCKFSNIVDADAV